MFHFLRLLCSAFQKVRIKVFPNYVYRYLRCFFKKEVAKGYYAEMAEKQSHSKEMTLRLTLFSELT